MDKTNPSLMASAAYRAAMQRLQQASQTEAEPTGSVFTDFLTAEMRSSVERVREGEAVALDAIAGKASVQEVVEALGAADFSLQKVTAVRDRVISAYQEIIRMPI